MATINKKELKNYFPDISNEGIKEIIKYKRLMYQEGYTQKSINQFMEICDKCLNGYGIETLNSNHYSMVYPFAEYINMGETYQATIVHDMRGNDRFFIESWGNFYERTFYDQDSRED